MCARVLSFLGGAFFSWFLGGFVVLDYLFFEKKLKDGWVGMGKERI